MHRSNEELGWRDTSTRPNMKHHACRVVCCVRVSADYTVGSFKFLHEQDRSPTAFWFSAHLLAWQGSLLGRDTDTATPYRSAKHSSSYSSAKN